MSDPFRFTGPLQNLRGRKKGTISIMLAVLLLLLMDKAGIGSETLTLERGIQITLKNNPAFKASKYSEEAAEQGVREAKGRFLPRIDLSESMIRTNGPGEVFWTELSQERFSLAEFSAGDPNEPDPITNYETALTLVQPIFAGGKIRTGYQISKLQRETAKSNRERTKQQIIREFTAAYYEALLADRFVDVAERSKRAVQAHVKMARDLLDQGMVLRSDFLRARVHLSVVQSMLITARNRRKLAAANLNRIMGTDQNTEYELQEEETETLVPEDLDQLIQEAKRNRPDLVGLSLMEQSAEKGIAMARSSYLPNLNVVARYNRNDRDFMGDDGEYWTLMAVAKINLFEGFSSQAKVHRARAEKAKMTSLVTQALQGIELEVRRAYLHLQEARARLEIARSAVSEAEESMKIIEDRYGAGMARITELLDTETALTEARTNLAKAQYDLNIAKADLDLAAGRL